jgi:hypothetical protein
MAFIIDIRRENMLLHLMYKVLAELSTDRVEFLSYLFARPRPTGLRTNSTAQALLDAFRPVPCSEKLAKANLRAVVDRLERVHGFTLSRGDANPQTIRDRQSNRAGGRRLWRRQSRSCCGPLFEESRRDSGHVLHLERGRVPQG